MAPSREPDTVEIPIGTQAADPVARYFGPGPPAVRVEFGALTHPGKVRPNNEDHYGVVRRSRSREVLLTNLPEGFLQQSCEEAYALAVADGMGGPAFGELASMFALRAGWDWTARAFKWHFQVTEQEARDLLEQLRVHGQLIQQALLEHARDDPRLTGMGTTITGALIVGSDAFVGHVGDSRAYLLHLGSLRQLTRDHTRAQDLVDAGEVASVADVPRFLRHVLTNCLGDHDREVTVDVHHVPLAGGDRLLLCTDGLTNLVGDEEIATILQRFSIPADACRALVDAALDRGGKDNVTVVLAHVAG